MSVWVFQVGSSYPTLDDVQNPTGTGTIPEWTAPYPIQAWMLEQGTEYPTSRHVQNPTATGRLSEMEAPNPTWMWHLFSGYKYPYLEAVDNIATSFPSQRYKDAIAMHSIRAKLTGAIKLPNGIAQELEDKDIVSDSLTIASGMLRDDTYYLSGGVPMAELSVRLFRKFEVEDLYNAELTFSYWLWLPETDDAEAEWYEIPLGRFYIADAVESTDAALSVSANDGMLKFSRVPFEDLQFTRGEFYTAAQIIMTCCTVAEVELGTSPAEISALRNGTQTFEVAMVDTSVETARDLLMHVCQLIGAFAYVDRFEKLRIRRVYTGESTRTIAPHQRIRSSVSQIPYQTYRVDAKATKYDGTSTQKWEGSRRVPGPFVVEGVRPEMPNNPLYAVLPIPDGGTWATACQRVFDNLVYDFFDVTYNPCELDTFGDPSIELGDWITARTREGAELLIPVTSYSWTYHGTHTLNSAGREAMAGVIRDQNDKAAQARDNGVGGFMDDLYRQLEELAIAQAIPYPIESSTGEWLITTTGEYLQYEYTEEE